MDDELTDREARSLSRMKKRESSMMNYRIESHKRRLGDKGAFLAFYSSQASGVTPICLGVTDKIENFDQSCHTVCSVS